MTHQDTPSSRTAPPPAFPPLPRPNTAQNTPRRCGVEVEFSGLTETQTAELVQKQLGGEITDTDPHNIVVQTDRLGKIKVELDTALTKYRDLPMAENALDMARAIVPVEIVTDPLPLAQLPELEALCATLRAAGAKGSDDGPLSGFGVHLNPEVVSADDAMTPRSILAYALLEDHLRTASPIDTTRRIMPFVDPWPRALSDALVNAGPDATLQDQRAIYAAHINSRNFGLDLLPLLKSADPDGYARDFPEQSAIKPRPAFHFRLPDSRIDDPNWTLAQEWQRWLLVESVADSPPLLTALCEAWVGHRAEILAGRQTWAAIVADLLDRLDHGPDQGPDAGIAA